MSGWAGRGRHALGWTLVLSCSLVALGFALSSDLLAWRDPIYILAGVAGVTALILLLFQPLLATGMLPPLSVLRGRRIHRLTGLVLLLCVTVHVVGLWITSPPDVIDALLFRSPTPFSAWGVVAMLAVFATALLATVRHHLHPRLWRVAHGGLAAIIATGTVVHALLIEGTMEPWSKAALCILVILATGRALANLKVLPPRQKHQDHGQR